MKTVSISFRRYVFSLTTGHLCKTTEMEHIFEERGNYAGGWRKDENDGDGDLRSDARLVNCKTIYL